MIDQELLLELTEAYLKSLFISTSNSLPADFDSATPFGELGIDSFYILKIVKKLEEDFGTLPKTLLFEYFNIVDLSRYFASKHTQLLIDKFSLGGSSGVIAPNSPVVVKTQKFIEPVAVEPIFDATKSNVAKSSPDNTAIGELAPLQLQKSPILILEKDAYAIPELKELIETIFNRYKNESSVSRGTRNIAPNLFIGSERRGYFNYSRSKNIILAYGYTGPADYFQVLAQEMLRHCISKNFELNIFTGDQIDSVGDASFSATPFGVMQRIMNIKDFTLQGTKMRRLRYQVSKFETTGQCKTEEYQCGSNQKVDLDIATIINQWCASRAMVNPLIYIVRDEVVAGTLNPQHRLFTTYMDDVLQNVILISPMAGELNGYLMDLEFYPQEMPLGGLEFAIVKIMEILVKEGCDVFSMGGTYGCKLHPSSNADAAVDGILDDLRKQNIFNDEGNLQFKNKFRPDNSPIYLCRPVLNSNPDSVIDIIMMIADPAKMQTSDEENHSANNDQQSAISVEKELKAPATHQEQSPLAHNSSQVFISGEARSLVLSEFGFNPMNVPHEQVEFDLKTDSWAQLNIPAIEKQMKHLHGQLQQPVSLDESLKNIFGLNHYVLASSGRAAEHIFYKAWDKKGKVLQNLLFPTGIFHQIDNDFTPVEIPTHDIFQLDSTNIFKGDLAWDILEAQITKDPAAISFICIEVSNNAAGGSPVSIQHLKKVKALLAEYSIPLVIDATRIVENAQFIIENVAEYKNSDVWAVVKEICSHADAVIASLAKDFCVNKGGIIATNDKNFFHKLQTILQEEGGGLDVIDKKLIALSLKNKKQIETQALRRMDAVRSLLKSLNNHNIPVIQPAGGHCVLLDVKQILEFSSFENPVASFIAWMFLNTGIRAGAHSVGMQKNTALNGLVRLAIPVGLQQEDIAIIAERLVLLFSSKKNIPEILLQIGASDTFGDVYANYTLKQYHNVSETPILADTSEKHILQVKLPDSIPVPSTNSSSHEPALSSQPPSSRKNIEQNKTNIKPKESQDIAIVGMAGRYPKAKNLRDMWQNLLQGMDCIDNISDDRLEMRRQNEIIERYRGGFIDDVDKFDSLFFNIAPREAEIMDPQERLFLETAWEAIEDAGYYPEILAQDKSTRDIGVFVGAVWAMYQTVGAEERFVGNQVFTNSFLWSIANRVSYSMNLTGPSLTVDTACSAGLTAIYLACESINNGECSGAIVGGVNLDVHQCKQDITVAGGLLSKDGVCRSFGKGGNGYVAGEGVGAVYLKSLEQAVQDGDHIYGVIKAAVVNHGGRTSGYSVPNSKAQTDLILSALNKAKMDARTISYIEAHGTGTELGDPIEITGLNNAFQSYNVPSQTCAIGSIKSNIGHLEAAAGVVGLTKVLLQMQHQQLVPSLHSNELNEFIDFENSPFYVPQKVEQWKGKEIDGILYPLRAGISSFGAGGSNAHIILESYEPATKIQQDENILLSQHIFPLSARNEDQLREIAVRLRKFIQDDLNGDASAQQTVNNIAFTLQLGRKSFDYRAAIVASTKTELIDKLTHFIDGKKDETILLGQVKNAEGITKLLSRKEKEAFINLLAQGRDPQKLAQLWIEGLLTDWQGLLGQKTGRRISLPTYPFADKRHWAADLSKALSVSMQPPMGMHPLIDSNQSTFAKQIFKKTFTDREFFIYDHLVSDIPTLPGVAYLDLARKAGEIAAGRKVRKIKNILWVSPLTVKNSIPTEAYIELKPSGDMVQFEVFSLGDDGKKQLYSQGKLFYETKEESQSADEYIDIASIRARTEKVIDGKNAYPLFKSLGLGLGPSFQVLQDIYKNENEVLGVLKIPEIRNSNFNDFLLHPSLVDGSFQAAMGAQLAGTSGEMFVPYSLGEVEIIHPLQPNCYSYVTPAIDEKNPNSKLSKANVFIVDETGKVLVKVRDSIGVPLTEVHEKPTKNNDDQEFPRLYYSNIWEKQPLTLVKSDGDKLDTILLFAPDDSLSELYKNKLVAAAQDTSAVILVQPGDHYEDLGEQRYRINPRNLNDFIQLFECLNKNKLIPDKICFAWPLSETTNKDLSLSDSLKQGVYSFLFLCKSLIEQKLQDKIQLVYLYPGKKDEPLPTHEAMNGFAKTLQLENPKIGCKILEIYQEKPDPDQILDAILAEFHPDAQNDVAVRYKNQDRYLRKVQKFDFDEASRSSSLTNNVSIKQNGVYLITGGVGGLGLIFAEFLARECNAKLVLTGRSALSIESAAKLEALRELGAEIVYISADISNYDDVKNLVEKSKTQFGQLNGIIHSAGVLRDSYIRNKTQEEMAAVLAPKVYGTLHLDALTKDEDMDFFVMFSSLAALVGNAGQCDYAFANHFMDSFAANRELLHAKGERFGKTLSINWSIWADGGMKLDEQTELFFRKNLGIKPLAIQTGIDAFTSGLASKKSQFAVLEGVQEKIETSWGLRKKAVPAPAPIPAAISVTATTTSSSPVTENGGGDLAILVQNELAKIVMEFLKLDESDIDLDSILLDLGFDSIGLTTFANSINQKYKLDVTPVLFFEYPSIREIAKYLAAENKAEISAVHGGGAAAKLTPHTPAKTGDIQIVENISFGDKQSWNPDSLDEPSFNSMPATNYSPERRFLDQPIAVVGMSGVMPQSENMEEYWDNLKNARNMISVIPEDRWNWENYYGDPLKEVNKSNSKWGGFMKEVDKFDPLFFGISPREAEMMDPQQRIFLETVWKTIEDAGHKVSDLSGTRTGLFVGAATHDYTDLMNSQQISLDGYTASGNSHSVLVNRVSFLLNLRGPSAPLDTSCSSSLVAIHRALESIHTGSCDMAIVGGVQVMLSPAAYISFGIAGMLSNDGKCKTFDKRADGYVRGEGSGAIFLKPLSMAEADGNHIYALIKATAENHGGRVTFLTAPNPNAQAELIIDAYEKAQIDPTTVGYIECHGTGTSLGDPIEIQALKKSFSELYKKYNKTPAEIPHCGLSAVKSNIGHLETAAGIAGILKVLLAIKHKQIPATLHFEELNPYINLAGSPFYVVDKTTEWEAIKKADGTFFPRRAGVSSFGFGGANAHIILEEYIPAENASVAISSDPQLIVLSAKSEDRLKAYAELLLAHIEYNDVNLVDLAYTLQVGRDSMSDRLGLIVNSVDELERKLKIFISGNKDDKDIHVGKVKRIKETHTTVSFDSDDEPKESDPDQLIAQKNFTRLLDLWVNGLEFDWNKIHLANKPKRISLPSYPFAKERYWFGTENKSTLTNAGITTDVLHPLLHSNASDFDQVSYKSIFTGKEFFLKDHQVALAVDENVQLTASVSQEQKVLPTVAYLEMARAAIEQALPTTKDSNIIELQDIHWMQSIVVAKNKQVSIAVFEHENVNQHEAVRYLGYEIYSTEIDEDGKSQEVIHCQGSAIILKHTPAIKLDIEQIKGQMTKAPLNPDLFYSSFRNIGIHYGPSYQAIRVIHQGEHQYLAELYLPDTLTASRNDYVLHPSLLNSALQLASELVIDFNKPSSSFAFPLSLNSLTIISPCTEEMYAWVRYSRGSKTTDEIAEFDIDLLDKQGKVCIKFKSLRFNNNKSAVIENLVQRSDFELLLDSIADGRSLDKTKTHSDIFETILDNIY